MHEKNNKKRKAKPRLPSKKCTTTKPSTTGSKSQNFSTQQKINNITKKIIKKTCITTNKIKTLQIKTNNTKTNMHNRKREKNLPARCFFIDSLVSGKIKKEPKTK